MMGPTLKPARIYITECQNGANLTRWLSFAPSNVTRLSFPAQFPSDALSMGEYHTSNGRFVTVSCPPELSALTIGSAKSHSGAHRTCRYIYVESSDKTVTRQHCFNITTNAIWRTALVDDNENQTVFCIKLRQMFWIRRNHQCRYHMRTCIHTYYVCMHAIRHVNIHVIACIYLHTYGVSICIHVCNYSCKYTCTHRLAGADTLAGKVYRWSISCCARVHIYIHLARDDHTALYNDTVVPSRRSSINLQ